MDFEDTPEEAAFRAEARTFLEANAERRKPGEVEGYRRGQDAPGAMDRAKAFQRKKADAGFVGIQRHKLRRLGIHSIFRATHRAAHVGMTNHR